MINEIKQQIEQLPRTHSLVIQMLYINKYSKADTADYMNMTVDRISQIEQTALRKLRHPV